MCRLTTLLLLFLAVLSSCEKKTSTLPAKISVIPAPVQVKAGDDFIQWDEAITIVAKSEEERNIGSLLQEFFESKNIQTTIAETGDKNKITFNTISDASLGKEAYKLTSNAEGVTVEANEGAGLFYGLQSFFQLVSVDGKQFPFVEITDYPRFVYRGLHLDVGRHMFPPAFIKKYIDLLAHHKYNRFHWHLTEDQGWRIEIKKYPKLVEVGANRKETVVGRPRRATRSQTKYDGKPYGGYYTHEEIKDIVKYAADRYVTIIPEIEMPGHASAALASHPNLGCTGGPYEVAKTWGVFREVYCAGKDETFVFLQDVLDEVMVLFPSEYIHIGGDECPKDSWKKCPFCQKRIKEEKLKDEHELQSYFILRIEKYLNSKGRKIIGWDEILEGGLAPGATVMSWRGEKGGIAAAKENHDVIMTPGNWCYFDHYQDTTTTNGVRNEPLAIGNYTPVSEVYSYEPVPDSLTTEEAKHILGAQANVWTEYIPTSDHVEYMVYPRASAMAEVLWSPAEGRNYEDFLRRMGPHFKRLDEWHVNYARHILKDVSNVAKADSTVRASK